MIIGIIGGGQLGMLLCQAAKKLNFKTIILDPNELCSARMFCDVFYKSEFEDAKILNNLFINSNVVIYEFENINLAILKTLEQKYPNKLFQSSESLFLATNRMNEKMFFLQNKALLPQLFNIAYKMDHILNFIHNHQGVLKWRIKTISGGYDGKGQICFVKDKIPSKKIANLLMNGSVLIEEHINFTFEISVIFVNNKQESYIICISKNYHKNGILIASSPFKASIKLQNKLKQCIAEFLMQGDLNGIFALEFFVTNNDQLIFNELAPRVHNSGHYTTHDANISQFTAQLMLVTNKKLPRQKLKYQIGMINLIGDAYNVFVNNRHKFDKKIVLFVDYKKKFRENRKLGHLLVKIQDIQFIVKKLYNFKLA